MSLARRLTAHRIASLLVILPTLVAQGAEFRNFNLPCLAPLLKQVDSEAPSTVNVAFLRGPWHAPQLRNDIGKWLGVTSGEIETIFPNLERFADPFTPGYDPTDYSTMLANANMDYLNGI
jgi:hypothetical protein